MFSSPFPTSNFEKPVEEKIHEADIIFVSDMFVEDYAGGAELTTEVLINSSDGKNICKIRSSQLTMELLSQGIEKFWIFTNFSGMDTELIPSIIANLRYSIVEYDFKFCAYRSPEKHEFELGEACDCQNKMVGKLVSAFFYGAESLFWMSDCQREIYESHFPFLKKKNSILLSSLFSPEFFEYVSRFSNSKNDKSETYLIVGSNSWIKGIDAAVSYCEDKNIEYEIVSGLKHEEMLDKMASSKGLVFLPLGGDTCPRTVIEAKLLGCDLIINDNVLHKDESWFSSSSLHDTVEWLMGGTSRFWDEIATQQNRQPTISGYTTTHNCISQKYPFEASIKSLLGFCDQVVVVDGGSTDGTIEKLNEIANNDERLIIHVQKRDWNNKRFAVYDGLQKAMARAICTGEFCWQQDSDEVVHERDYEKVKQLVRKLPKTMDLVALPVLEFWGSKGKLRIDVNPWKWRLSRNRPHITHGIPATLRKFDDAGELYSLPGSDGCDYVRSDTYDPIPFVNFYTEDAHKARELAINGAEDALAAYSSWLQNITNGLPSVIHYSWYDIERKIKTYKNYWSRHWQSLYDISQEDTAENNMFFDKKWSDVTDQDISDMASRLETEIGGWIFHSKVDFNKPTSCITVGASIHPSSMGEWIK